MKLNGVLPGTYVVAVSGGVDSMVLLDLLTKSQNKLKLNLIVAHLDHGIRSDSKKDLNLVKKVSQSFDLIFESKCLKLGPNISEAVAREKRYEFLESIRQKYEADSIITAHHQDDLIETAIVNLIRGSGRKGLSSLSSTKSRLRPLLNYPKSELINYANKHKLDWREDSTNLDQSYLRNYVRHKIVSRLDKQGRTQFVTILQNMSRLNLELDSLINNLLTSQSSSLEIERQWFNLLPHNASKEVLASWLRNKGIRDFNKFTLERLVVAAKVSPSNQHFPIYKQHSLEVNNINLALGYIER